MSTFRTSLLTKLFASLGEELSNFQDESAQSVDQSQPLAAHSSQILMEPQIKLTP